MIDFAEVFIEGPKSLSAQAAAWSDHMRNNSFKCLFGSTRTGFFSFLSFCYGDRPSNRFMARDSGFYNLLERDDDVMADAGFQIQGELLLHFCRLVVPPGT